MLYLKYFITASILLFSKSSIPEIEAGIDPKIEIESDRISWDPNDKLEWSDFKANADNNSTLDAYTMLGISLEILGQKDGVVDMGVFGYFEKDKSWVKSQEKNNRLLLHEQKHFDLCEVFRRKLVQRLEEGNPYAFDSFSAEVGKTFNTIFAEYTKEQDHYDHETNHSQKKEEQIKWNNFIEKELLRLEKYDKLAATLKVK